MNKRFLLLACLFATLLTIPFKGHSSTPLALNSDELSPTIDPRLAEFPTLHIVDHPLVHHKLALLRAKETDCLAFRRLLREIGLLLGYEVTRALKTKEISLITPMAQTTGKAVEENNVVVAPVLRAGLGMAEGLRELIPSADISHIGLYRDPETKKPVEYLFKTPPIKDQTFIVVDPMLATGGSAAYAVTRLIKAGVNPKNILFMALVVAPEGMRVFQKEHPNIPVIAASLDSHLDSHAYIIPGLGDAGDRLNGTCKQPSN